MSKYDNKDWSSVPFYRKRYFVVIWMFLFWPISLLCVLTGRIYRKVKNPTGNPASPQAMALKPTANIAVALWPLFIAVMFTGINTAFVQPQRTCESIQHTAIKALDGATLMHNLHISVISFSQPTELYRKGDVLTCAMQAKLSNARVVTIKYVGSQDSVNHDEYTVYSKIEN